MEGFAEARLHLICDKPAGNFVADRASRYATAIYEKSNALPNVFGFIKGTVISIARFSDRREQNAACNGHKRKLSLKFQAVTFPDGTILHVPAPIEGRRHYWTLSSRSGLDEVLGAPGDLLNISGSQYVVYGDSGYNWRPFMEIPYQGANLSEQQRAFNEAMSACRVTVEWDFKEVKL
eukprot:Plantae.Rhodophyta-Palmaria_palmata.ctg2218.p1 GENE.Plantae.Rhodophyta-Palmaria_palmata.ctg2218~~Plantae.Rhodophyta-Palmaria_palmata.ctg2218.p1  ORF type:complete len:178 (+),score=22.05 Plantae.Rhodophyta-Palmaria_palmata.ctg2218:290-823(+)